MDARSVWAGVLDLGAFVPGDRAIQWRGGHLALRVDPGGAWVFPADSEDVERARRVTTNADAVWWLRRLAGAT